jgi:hypothetical protein
VVEWTGVVWSRVESVWWTHGGRVGHLLSNVFATWAVVCMNVQRSAEFGAAGMTFGHHMSILLTELH